MLLITLKPITSAQYLIIYKAKRIDYTRATYSDVFKTDKRKKAIFPDWHLGAAQRISP